MKTIQAQCRCGEVQLQLAGDALAQFYCHCDDCQAAHSAAFVSASLYPATAVQVPQGEPEAVVIRATSRMRCKSCGTFLYSELPGFGMRSVNSYLLAKEDFKPQFHVQCQHAVLPVVDKLPHFKAFPAKFGGADVMVDW